MNIGHSLKAWAQRIKRDGLTLWFAAKHPDAPWYAKALGLFVVAYALSPIDLIRISFLCWAIWTTCCCCRRSSG